VNHLVKKSIFTYATTCGFEKKSTVSSKSTPRNDKKWTSLDSTRQKWNQFTLDFTKPNFRPMLQRVFSIQLYKNGFFLKKKLK